MKATFLQSAAIRSGTMSRMQKAAKTSAAATLPTRSHKLIAHLGSSPSFLVPGAAKPGASPSGEQDVCGGRHRSRDRPARHGRLLPRARDSIGMDS
jgi:hypothetical protein